ncbi:uncharacterized protein F5147DRAFT_651428 [Suillus discolor]|uniref:Uncharacterized protein n=1 Tax=Suillus discolor TaxID=1912936 RepID=A0A9P7FAQ3_9AGAM|nr:uncharacterized protein F5147DRAFT_651428 [Suillus discolor]KAG2111227.1 hypothetical protein F5147DRAFT_651428 [Suillus discolor]
MNNLANPTYFDYPIHPSRFPISSIRPDGPQNTPSMPPRTPPKPVFPRYDPLHVLSANSIPLPTTKQSSLHPLQVAPGVLANGVITVMLPAVREFLTATTIAPPAAPELPSDSRVLALAALAVFYRPMHPAHWVFWNKEQKRNTAAIVQSVLDTTPTPIISPIGWIATQDNLWILGSLQHAYSSALSSQPWYAAYVPSESETRMSLRKRKPTMIQEQVIEDDDDDLLVPQPPRKRARTRRTVTTTRSPRKPEEFSPPDNPETEDVPDEVEAATELPEPEIVLMLTRAAKRELIEIPVPAQDAEKSVSPEPRRSQRKKGDSPASSATTLTRIHSRELSAESVEGAESAGSSTVCEEEPDKEKTKKGRTEKAVKRLDNTGEDGDEEEAEQEKPVPAKRSRPSASRAKPRSRAPPKRTNSTNTNSEEGGEHADATSPPPVPKPKSRSRPRTRRR